MTKVKYSLINSSMIKIIKMNTKKNIDRTLEINKISSLWPEKTQIIRIMTIIGQQPIDMHLQTKKQFMMINIAMKIKIDTNL
jgi:hypothetical protein